MTPHKYINDVWSQQVLNVMHNGSDAAPRGMPIREILGNQMKIWMKDPIVTLESRKMNFRFAFGEAWWILSGSNEVEGPRGITQFMKRYVDYSDDGVTMNGAYGPKFVEQLSWVVAQLEKDRDTRQAIVNFWRDRPGPSKDIPCTLTQQYFIRDGKLHVVATMRSNDLMWGTCYDTFTFTMMAVMVQTLLRQRGIYVDLGNMTLNAGSAHIYEPQYENAINQALGSPKKDPRWERFLIEQDVYIMDRTHHSRQDMLDWLYESAEWFRLNK